MTDEAMPSIAIFYGSSTGNTQDAAEKIKGELGDFVSHMADVVAVSYTHLRAHET